MIGLGCMSHRRSMTIKIIIFSQRKRLKTATRARPVAPAAAKKIIPLQSEAAMTQS
jgi:hypothetical protein